MENLTFVCVYHSAFTANSADGIQNVTNQMSLQEVRNIEAKFIK